VAEPIIITGMHRSGTSLVASLLQEGGLSIGERLLGPNEGNRKGHFEDVDFVELHEDILAHNGTSLYLDDLPAQLQIGEDHQQRAAALIDARRDEALWGWKDPRTALFLDFWFRLMPGAKFVFVFRPAEQVVDSLRRRQDPGLMHHFHGAWVLNRLGFSTFRMKQALNMWRHYNREIIRFAEAHAEQCCMLDVRSLVEDPSRSFRRLRDRLGFEIGRVDFSRVYDRQMLHSEVDAGVRRACQRQRDVAHLEAQLSEMAAR
jgi:hypothetical protein